MHDKLQHGGQQRHTEVTRGIGDLIQGCYGQLHLPFRAQLAGKPKSGGYGRGVGGPDDAVQAHGIKPQRARVLGDMRPDFWLALKGGRGEIGQGGVEVGAGAGYGGIDKRCFTVINLLQDELIDGRDGELGGGLAGQ